MPCSFPLQLGEAIMRGLGKLNIPSFVSSLLHIHTKPSQSLHTGDFFWSGSEDGSCISTFPAGGGTPTGTPPRCCPGRGAEEGVQRGGLPLSLRRCRG